MKTSLTKTLAIVATVAAVLGAASYAHAGDRTTRNRADKRLTQGERQTPGGLIIDSDERYVMVTGSNIPQKVTRRSIGTDGAHNVRIFTQKELRSINGGFGVGGIALDPSVTISGR
jgi:hypothetical protein